MTQPRASRLAVRVLAVALGLVPLSTSRPAFAVNKDLVQLQTQVQQLEDAVARLQQSNDERMGVLKDLVQQNSDSVNRMSSNLDGLQKQLVAEQSAGGGKLDTVSGQVQSLNDSLDELKARMNRLEKLLGDVQSQTQSISASLQSGAQPGNQPGGPSTQAPSAGGFGNAQPGAPASSQTPPAGTGFRSTPPAASAPSPADPNAFAPGSPLPAQPSTTRKPSAATPASAPRVEDLYRSAYGDYMTAKYALATSEFNDVISTYPDNTLSGNAFYYLGEIEYRNGKYAAAAKEYDKVLEQFPDNNKIPASHLHKGEALLALKQTDAGVRELRALIQRFPNSPESVQARSKLNALGVPLRPRT